MQLFNAAAVSNRVEYLMRSSFAEFLHERLDFGRDAVRG